MYKILTKASITKLLVFTGVQISVASSATCPSQLAPIDQTFNICTKLVNAQVGCVTNVDSYRLYACTYVASMIDISTIVCYRQVLFVAVTTLLRFLEEKNIFLLLQVFTKFHVQSTAHVCLQLYVTGKFPYIPRVPSLSTMWD